MQLEPDHSRSNLKTHPKEMKSCSISGSNKIGMFDMSPRRNFQEIVFSAKFFLWNLQQVMKR